MGLKILGGVGLLLSVFGVIQFWASYTAPVGHSEPFALSTTQRLARMIPHEISTRIALVLATLFIVFGLFLLFTAIYRALKFLLFGK